MNLARFLLCITVVINQQWFTRGKRASGDAWIIKSTLIGDEFNRLEVQKTDKPTVKSEIARPRALKGELKGPERDPEKPLTRTFIAERPGGSLSAVKTYASEKDVNNQKRSSGEMANHSQIMAKIDDQDATDNGELGKRMLQARSASSNIRGVRHRMSKVLKPKRMGNRTERQEIESNPDSFAGEFIGRPYGDPDEYKSIGDGIFLMSTEQEAAIMPHLTGTEQPLYGRRKASSKAIEKDQVKAQNMPEPSPASLPEILTHLDADAVKPNATVAAAGNASVKSGEKDTSRVASLSKADGRNVHQGTVAVGSHVQHDDLEGMTPNELNALESFQNKLGFEDKAIGKIILSKNVDTDQQDYLWKTKTMLEKDNQQQINKIVGKFKEEESSFVQKNPYVINKLSLLEQIKNVSFNDARATKRGFLGTNDNVRIEKVYNSLLKEDDLISQGLNTKASVRKAISRINNNQEDAQVNDFLNFLEKEDRVTEGANIGGKRTQGAKAKKPKNEGRSQLKQDNKHLLIMEPSLGVLADTYSADGSPQLKDSDIKNIATGNIKKKRREKVLKAYGERSRKPAISREQREFNSTVSILRHNKESNEKKVIKKVARKIRLGQLKVLEMGENDDIEKARKKPKLNKKNQNRERQGKAYENKKVAKTRRQKKGKVGSFASSLSMVEGKMTSELLGPPPDTGKEMKGKNENEDKDYLWHGTVKPETRQLPTSPGEEIRKFGRISNITPVGFEGPSAEGMEEVIGDMNNIANIGAAMKDNEDGDNHDANLGEAIQTIHEGSSQGFKKIDENEVSSTSFLSAPKSQKNVYKEIMKQGMDPVAQNVMGVALNQIDSKDFQRVKGFVDTDHSKIMALFDPASLKPKIEEFVQDNEKDSDEESEENSVEENHQPNHKLRNQSNKKHKLKIVLHLPEEMEGGEQEIHGKDSEMPIGTIKDLTAAYSKSHRKPGLGQQLADDDEDTLEEILSKPTGKLEQFHPATTESAVDYVPESVQGKESNEWTDNSDTEKGMIKVELNEQSKERNDDMVDNLKSNKLLAMIKNNEDVLQKALGRNNNGEKIEGFVKKIEQNEEGGFGQGFNDEVQSKSFNKKKKKGKEPLKRKEKSNKKKQSQKESYKESRNDSPNIFEDQLNYEHKSKEVSQVMPTETVNQIKEIFSADEQLMPISFLEEDQKALSEKAPRISSTAKKMPIKASLGAALMPHLSKVISNAPIAHHQPNKLYIHGGNIHGGNITGGVISGGEISGGKIQGGVIAGGRILGGTFKNGRIENGVVYDGEVDGGLIRGGSIYGGKIESGLITGGKIKGGEVDGGKMSGGEMDGGFLKSGEIRGGVLKAGSVEGGILRGGSIEGGHLLGGVMLGGKLKGGLVRAGIIKGGVIEGGTVDGGVIEDGVVIKGGVVRGAYPHNSTVVFSDNFEDDVAALTEVKRKESGKNTEASHQKNESEPTSKAEEKEKPNGKGKLEGKSSAESKTIQTKGEANESRRPKPTAEPVEKVKATIAQMFKIRVDSANQDSSAEPFPLPNTKDDESMQQQKQNEGKAPTDISILGAPESWPIEGEAGGKQSDKEKQKVAPVTYSQNADENQRPATNNPAPYSGEKKKLAIVKSFEGAKAVMSFHKPVAPTSEESEFDLLSGKIDNAAEKSILARSVSLVLPSKRSSSVLKDYGTTTRATIDARPKVPKYHWSLNSIRGGKILGNPGKGMSVIGGIKVHNGIATLNEGIDRGYLDAGDYQGECVSDPDVCRKGLTIALTSKIYKDSVDSPTRMYLFDSGASSEDSRGMALWVNKGKIEGAISTRKGSWCLEEDLDRLQDRWVDYVMTWHPMKGLYLYANCELLAVSGFGRGCDVCSRSACHQEDKNTHLMFGRPNKGPHFKLTHFASGDITIYEDFFNTEGVNELCGTNNDNLRKPSITSQRIFANIPIKSPLDSGTYVMKKEKLSKTSPEFKVPSLDPKVVANEFEVWPTPSGLQSLSALFQKNTHAKAATRQNVQVNGGYSDWSAWTSCIGACGGTSMSTRYCNRPVPKNGGHDCSIIGPARRTRSCDETNCLAQENLKALARLQSESSFLETDISKRKEIAKYEPIINQRKDIDDLKEELNELKD